MDYEEKKSSEDGKTAPYVNTGGDGVLEVREPPMYYGEVCGGGGKGGIAEIADDRDGDDCDDGINWDAIPVPKHLKVSSHKQLYDMLTEGLEDMKAGRSYSVDEVFDELERDIKNGTL